MNVFVHAQFDAIYRERPLILADVGARGGLKKNWQVARPHLRVLGFEPDVQEYTRLVTQHPQQPDRRCRVQRRVAQPGRDHHVECRA
jgi:hypothetical protein